MEKFLEYFGQHTPAADGAIATFKIEYLTSLLVAAIVIFMGRAMVGKSKLLKKYAIPAPVVSEQHLHSVQPLSIDITALIPVAGKMGVILAAQGILVAIFAIFVSYRMFGKE